MAVELKMVRLTLNDQYVAEGRQWAKLCLWGHEDEFDCEHRLELTLQVPGNQSATLGQIETASVAEATALLHGFLEALGQADITDLRRRSKSVLGGYYSLDDPSDT